MTGSERDEAIRRIQSQTILSRDEAESLVRRYDGIPCFEQIIKAGLLTGFWPDAKAFRL
jgi:hypothetical protein